MDIRALNSASDSHIVSDFFVRATDYVMLESGRPVDSGTTTEFFDDRPPNIAISEALHFGVFEADNLLGLIGCSFGYPDPADSYIGLLLLSPMARGMGLGVRALDHATNLARTRGATRQLVTVLKANPKGRAFWEREGFVLEKTFAATGDCHIRHRLTRPI